MNKTSYIFKHLTGTLVFFLILFFSAGRIDYWQGWMYVIIGLAMFTLNYTAFPVDPELLDERSKPGEGTKKWDKRILGLSFLVTLAMFVTAGLDSGRYRWSPDLARWWYLAGILLTVTGQLVFLIAQKQNRFFSSTMRIQTERGHTVCDTGLYGSVRHPAYAGMIIQSLGFPLLFGSLWSIAPVVLSIVLVLVRTHLEDHALKNELDGYVEYAQKTRYRIIPYIW